MGLITLAANLFIRPVRSPYSMDSLGPTTFRVGSKPFERQDHEITNSFGLKLQGSLYRPAKRQEPGPCIIYLHGSGANRLDSLDTLDLLLAYDIALFCLDLTGAGASEGKYISLGYHEKNDVKAVIAYLRDNKLASKIGLWGRSMGASTALLFCGEEQEEEIVTLILDSPFGSLKLLTREIVTNAKINNIPQSLTRAFSKLGLRLVRKNIRARAHFDIYKVEPLRVVDKCRPPAFFIHANSDTLINPHHSDDLCDKYGGAYKRVLRVEGTHSSMRVASVFDEASEFIHEHFLSETERERIPKPLRIVPQREEGAHYFLCKELPIQESAMLVCRFQANNVVCISRSGIKLYRPFTDIVFVEYTFDEITGFWLETPEVFLFKLKAEHKKPILKFNEEGFSEGSNEIEPGVYAFYSIEAMAIMKLVEQTTKDLFVEKLLDASLRGSLLQAVALQTAKQAHVSANGRPDGTMVTKDICVYLENLLKARGATAEQIEEILHPVPFFVSSSLSRVAQELGVPEAPPPSDGKRSRFSRRASSRASLVSPSLKPSDPKRSRSATVSSPPVGTASQPVLPQRKAKIADVPQARTRSATLPTHSPKEDDVLEGISLQGEKPTSHEL